MAEPTTKPKIAQWYLVIDLSGSMSPHLSTLQASFEKLVTTFRSNPVISKTIRLSVIGFGTHAKTLLPLCDIALELESTPIFENMGLTQYLSAFQELQLTVESNIMAYRDKYELMRPTIVFLTDGCPTDQSDEWLSVRSRLLEPNWRPNILAFGYGTAKAETIYSIATQIKGTQGKHAYIDNDTPVNQMLSELFPSLIGTMINAGGTIAMGLTQQEFTPGGNFRPIDMEPI